MHLRILRASNVDFTKITAIQALAEVHRIQSCAARLAKVAQSLLHLLHLTTELHRNDRIVSDIATQLSS